MPDDPSDPFGRYRQVEVYTGGLVGQEPTVPVAYEELRAAAEDGLSGRAYDYVAGSAGSEDTARANREAFRRWRLVPRMLRDVAERRLRVDLFGRTLPVPFLLAPVGVQSIVHEEGELATARAAASLDVPFVLSSAASETMEDVVAAAGDAPRWFQLYWSADRDVTASLVERAEAAGYEAVVVTLDTTLLGWRERDIQDAYLPFLEAEGVANYVSDPAFRARLADPPEENPDAAVMEFVDVFSDPALTWDDLADLREHTDLPIVLKGVLHPDDARLAVEHGADGLVVSNHGGRQVDGAIPALDALPGVVDAVEGEIPVLFDSGIRRGADALKAIALGAEAVLLGRPWVYGLALAGQAGVESVVKNFRADLDLTLALTGYDDVGDVDRACLFERDR